MFSIALNLTQKLLKYASKLKFWNFHFWSGCAILLLPVYYCCLFTIVACLKLELCSTAVALLVVLLTHPTRPPTIRADPQFTRRSDFNDCVMRCYFSESQVAQAGAYYWTLVFS